MKKNIVYTFLFLMLIALITSGSLKGAFVLNANDMHIKVVFIWTFWYLICIFVSSYESGMNFQSFGQTVKGHSRDHDQKSKGKTEQAWKVRAEPVGRNQLGVKMQLSHFYSPHDECFAWSILYDLNLCFLVYHNHPCCTHLLGETHMNRNLLEYSTCFTYIVWAR